MNIGIAAKISSLTIKTVRYYSNINLLNPYINPKTGYRSYTNEDIAKLQFIGKARKYDFSIDECRELLSLYEDKNRSSKDVKKLTLQKLNKIEQKLIELKSLKNELRHLVNSCQGNKRPECPILEKLSKRKN